jgi:Cupin domain
MGASRRRRRISSLYTNPVSKATYLVIRAEKNAHVPRHWHTANETLTILKGTFVLKRDGSDERSELTPGSFGYMPARWCMRHGPRRTARCISSPSMGLSTSTGLKVGSRENSQASAWLQALRQTKKPAASRQALAGAGRVAGGQSLARNKRMQGGEL